MRANPRELLCNRYRSPSQERGNFVFQTYAGACLAYSGHQNKIRVYIVGEGGLIDISIKPQTTKN